MRCLLCLQNGSAALNVQAAVRRAMRVAPFSAQVASGMYQIVFFVSQYPRLACLEPEASLDLLSEILA